MYGNILHARNVNEALPLGLMLLKERGVPVESRGLRTIEAPGPVMTVYRRPQERVLFCPDRDANPFFHFFEALWVLSGSNRVHMPTFFLPKLMEYSDDGRTFYGAYGYRLRNAPPGVDQITASIGLLRRKPDTRQCVLAIWNVWDLGVGSKDVPCNDTIALKIRDGHLNTTVFCRSNDIIWGAYGANAVQFSVLQEYIASAVGVEVGTYTQVSDSFHAYESNPLWQAYVSGEYHPAGHVVNPYEVNSDYRTPLFSPLETAEQYADIMRLEHLLSTAPSMDALEESITKGFESTLFRGTVLPMLRAFIHYRKGDIGRSLMETSHISANDWRAACARWLTRRQDMRLEKEAQ